MNDKRTFFAAVMCAVGFLFAISIFFYSGVLHRQERDFDQEMDEFLQGSLVSPTWDGTRYDCLQYMIRKDAR